MGSKPCRPLLFSTRTFLAGILNNLYLCRTDCLLNSNNRWVFGNIPYIINNFVTNALFCTLTSLLYYSITAWIMTSLFLLFYNCLDNYLQWRMESIVESFVSGGKSTAVKHLTCGLSRWKSQTPVCCPKEIRLNVRDPHRGGKRDRGTEGGGLAFSWQQSNLTWHFIYHTNIF